MIFIFEFVNRGIGLVWLLVWFWARFETWESYCFYFDSSWAVGFLSWLFGCGWGFELFFFLTYKASWGLDLDWHSLFGTKKMFSICLSFIPLPWFNFNLHFTQKDAIMFCFFGWITLSYSRMRTYVPRLIIWHDQEHSEKYCIVNKLNNLMTWCLRRCFILNSNIKTPKEDNSKLTVL